MEVLNVCFLVVFIIYDMCKVVDKKMVISNIYFVEKIGGKLGDFKFE